MGTNRYAYAANNPVNVADPSGHKMGDQGNLVGPDSDGNWTGRNDSWNGGGGGGGGGWGGGGWGVSSNLLNREWGGSNAPGAWDSGQSALNGGVAAQAYPQGWFQLAGGDFDDDNNHNGIPDDDEHDYLGRPEQPPEPYKSPVKQDILMGKPAPVAPKAAPGKVAPSGYLDPDDVEKAGKLITGPNWRPANIKDDRNWNGCEACAAKIQDIVGGTITRISPPTGARFLGGFMGASPNWRYHEVVVNNGTVYDAFTGSQGMSVDNYKSKWQYHDVINFGF